MQLITTRNKEISIPELKEAISSGNGLEVIRPFDKLAIELKNGERVSPVFEHKIINFVKTVEQKVKNPSTSQHGIPTKIKTSNK